MPMRPEQIHRCFQSAMDQMPAYCQMLPFFRDLYTLELAGVAVARPEVPAIEADTAARRLDSGHALLDRVDIDVDVTAARDLLASVCDLAKDANPALAETTQKVRALMNRDAAMIEQAFLDVAHDELDAVDRLAETIGGDPSMIRFLLYSSIWPSLARHARQLAPLVDGDSPRSGKYCPICGEQPALSYLIDEGHRHMACGFCRHQWPVARMGCSSCGSRDAGTLGYFYDERQPAYRVHTCDQCRHYIKTVDCRQLARAFFAPLEVLLTAHLDLRAGQMSYLSTAPDWLQI